MFRFAIRDILWLTLVAALTLSWLTERASARKLATKYQSLCCEVRWCPPGMHIVFDDDDHFRTEVVPDAHGVWAENKTVRR